jgi:hypothetical protein
VDTPYTWELNIWYHTLNAGYKARISGETDFPCIYGEKVGLGRSYVRQPKLDYTDWVHGIRDGRNYVSDGKSHLLDFKVNNVEMGTGDSTLKMAAPGPVKVTAKVAALLGEKPDDVIRNRRVDQKPYWELERARMGNTRKVPLELLVNGNVVATREVVADGVMRDVAFDVKIEKSAWVALRILPSSHTNPVWVTVADKPIRVKDSIEWCLAAVEKCFNQKIGRIRLTEQGEMKTAYDEAKAVYQGLLKEAN